MRDFYLDELWLCLLVVWMKQDESGDVYLKDPVREMCIWTYFALQPSALFLDFLKQISPALPHRKSSSLIWQQDTLTYPTTIARRYQKSPRGSLKVSQWLMCSAFQTSRQEFVPNKNQKLCSPSAPTFILKSCSGSEDGWHSCSARLQSRLSSFLKRVSPAVRALCFITVDFRLRQKGEMRLTRWRQLKCFQYLLSSCVASVTPALVTCDQSWDELHPCWARPGFLSRAVWALPASAVQRLLSHGQLDITVWNRYDCIECYPVSNSQWLNSFRKPDREHCSKSVIFNLRPVSQIWPLDKAPGWPGNHFSNHNENKWSHTGTLFGF